MAPPPHAPASTSRRKSRGGPDVAVTHLQVGDYVKSKPKQEEEGMIEVEL